MSEIKGVRIVSDGTIFGTKVYSADGEDLTQKLHIRGIQWKHNAGGIPVAVITSSLAAIEGVADVEHRGDLLDTSILGEEDRSYETAAEFLGIPEVDHVKVFKPEDDQILVIKARVNVSDEVARRIRQTFEEKFPGRKCIVLGRDLELLIANLPENAPIHLQTL